jgi:4-amino-4-deoxy-L-arabinose transferase-like glycosyltransferase
MTWVRANVVEKLPAGLVLLLLGVAAFDFLSSASSLVPFPFPLDFGEAAMLDQTVRLARLETVYPPDLTTPPYVIWNFPALFSLVQVPALALFGPSFWYGRLLSAASIVAAAASLAWTLYRLTRDRLAAVIGGLSLLAIPMVSFWACLNRVDSLALGLSWSGLALLIRRPTSGAHLVASATLLTAAIYTRQSYGLAAPMAALAWLVAERSYPEAKRLVLLLVALCLGLLLLLNWATDGGFVRHIVFANVNEYRLEIVRNLVLFLVALMPLYFVVGALVLVRTAGRTSAWSLGASYLVGATLSAVTAGKVGSNVNYFFELFAGLCFALGVFVASQRGVRRKLVLALMGAQVLLLMLFQSPQFAEAELRLGAIHELEPLREMIARADGPVLADEYLGMLPIAGKEVYFHPFIFTQLARLGKWDQKPILTEMASRRFPIVVLRDAPENPMTDAWWTAEMRAAIEENYEVWRRFPRIRVAVYRPKGMRGG